MSTSYTDVFTGKNITAAFPQYSAIALTENITLSWPAQFQNTNHVVSVIMDITPDAPGRTVKMPNATEGSVGFAFTINNPGADSFDLLDITGNPIVTIFSIKANLIWLIDTAFPAGAWRNIPAFGGAGAVTSVDADSDSNNLVITGTPPLPITTGGTINFSLQHDLLALTQFGPSTGFSVRTEVDTWNLRSILGTPSQISIVDGDGVAGSPIISLSPNISGINSITLAGLSFGVVGANVIASTGLNVPIVLTPNGTGAIRLSNDTEIRSGNRFKFFNATNTNYISFRAGATGVDQDLAWPTVLATPTQVMANDGFGSLYWASVTTYAGASTVDAVARYSNLTGSLKDSTNFIVTDAGAATGLISCVVGHIRIATFDSQTIKTTTLDQDLIIAPSGNGSLRNECDVRIQSSGGFQRKLRLYNLASNFYAGLQADPAMAASTIWTWPPADSAGTFVSDGGGSISIAPFTDYFPAVSTINAVARYSTITGRPLKNSTIIIDDLGNSTGFLSAVIGGLSIATNIITPTAANTDLNLTPTGTGVLGVTGELQVKPAAGVSKSIKLFNNAGTFFSALKALPALAGASTTWTLPAADSAGIFTSAGAGAISITALTSYFPAVSTVNAVPRYSNITGSPLKDSLFVITDVGAGTGLASCVIGNISIGVAAANTIITTGVNQDLNISPNGTGMLVVSGDIDVMPTVGAARPIKLYNDAGTFFSGLKAVGGLGASTTWTLPTADFNALMSSNGAGALTLATGLTAPGTGKIGMGTTVFEATSTNSITFLNGTAAVGAAAANSLTLQSIPATSTVGTTLAWYGSGTGGIYAGIANASTHKINIKINGTNYYIMATTVA